MSLIPFPGAAPALPSDARNDHERKKEGDNSHAVESQNADGTVQCAEEAGAGTRGNRKTAETQGRAEKQALKEIVERYAYLSAWDRYVYRADPLKNPLTSKAFAKEIVANYKLPKKGRRAAEWKPSIPMVDAAGLVHATTTGFAPGEPAVFTNELGQTILNTYLAPKWASHTDTGGACQQSAEIEAPRPFLDLVALLCNDDPKITGHVLDWMAHLVQKPWEKPAHAVLIVSKVHGVGKSTLGRVLKALVGATHARTVFPQDLKGTHSGWLVGALAVVIDEVYEAGNWNLSNRLKPLITEERASVDIKYGPAMETENLARFLMFSNHLTPLSLEAEDRRFLVVECRQGKREQAFYDQLNGFIKSDEGMQAIYDFLTARDIGAFAAHAAPPMTDAKQEIIRESGNPVEAFLRERMATGELWRDLPNPFTFTHVQTYLRDKGLGQYSYNRRIIGEGLKEAGFKSRRRTVDDQKVAFYTHPKWPEEESAEDEF
ncbi:primase-helicase family protein [Pseudochelatococcus sp. B33]